MVDLKVQLQLIEDMIESLEYVRNDIITSEVDYIKTVSCNEVLKVNKKLGELIYML